MPDFFLDCNHLSAFLSKNASLIDRFHGQRRLGHRFISCIPVLCELEVGIQQTLKPEDNRLLLGQFLKHVRLWPVDVDTTRYYGAIYLELRKRGRVLSQVDMIIASMARQHDLVILTTDKDFEALPDITVENWVDEP